MPPTPPDQSGSGAERVQGATGIYSRREEFKPAKLDKRITKKEFFVFGKHTAPSCTRCNRASLWYFALLSLALPVSVSAADCELPAAQAVSVQGTVETATPNAQHWTLLRQGDAICPGDRLRVGRNSRAGLYLDSDTFLRLGELTTVTFPAATAKPAGWLELLCGVAHFMSRVRNAFEITTPYVNAAIEGTEFTVA